MRGDRLTLEPTNQEIIMKVPIDWRPQAIRIFSIFFVVVGHMFFTTGYLLNDAIAEPLIWLGGVAIGAFIMCSGYVHGLKDEFNKPGSLNRSTFVKFFKGRFFRLYIGYYLALIAVLIAKLLAGFSISFSATGIVWGNANPIVISPLSLVLDLTCTWPLFTAATGGIWCEGWFICAIMVLSFAYPVFRRLYSMNRYYLYSIMIALFLVRLFFIFFINANYAYFFPFAWTAEFSFGIILGDRVRRSGGPKPPSASYQRIIITAAERVWPLYLFHMVVIVFMTTPLLYGGQPRAPYWEFLIAVAAILVVTECFHRMLGVINKKLGVKKKRPLN